MSIQAVETTLPGVLLIDVTAHGDHRGFFLETWRAREYAALGVAAAFQQDNAAFSRRGVLRGLHYQQPHAQGKLVSVLLGEVFDVAVDLRLDSPTFGQWEGHYLSSENHRQLWIPPGFAHGYQVVSDSALFTYKCTERYVPESEVTLLYNDPAIGIVWPIADAVVSDKDRAGTPLARLRREKLFQGGNTPTPS